MGDLPRVDMADPPFTQMLARAVFDGGILASLLPALAIVAAPLFGASPNWVPSPFQLFVTWFFGLIYLAVFWMTVAVAIMAPIAALLAWPAYRRGAKSYTTYITLGAFVGLLTPLLLVLIFRVPVPAHVTSLPFIAWFVVSSAFGGWSFADQLSRQVRPERAA